MVALAALSAFAAVAALLYSVLNKVAPLTAEQRLSALTSERVREGGAPAEDAGPSRGELVATKLRQFLPSRLLARMAVFLQNGGIQAQPEIVLALWIGSAVGLPVLYLVAAAGNGIAPSQEVLALALGGLCAYAPLMIIRGRIRKRRTAILKGLPDMMDLLTTCVEAGLGIDAALAKVAEKAKEPLAEEVRIILRTMAMGRPRRDALQQFSDRVNLPEVVSLTGAIIQAERMGVSLGQVLRVQSDAMRVQRKQRAEQKAYKAPVKIIVVLALFIFPSMFVVIIGPAALPFLDGGHGSSSSSDSSSSSGSSRPLPKPTAVSVSSSNDSD